MKFQKDKGGYVSCWLNAKLVASISPTLHITTTRGTLHLIHIFNKKKLWGRTKRDAKRIVKNFFTNKGQK